MHLQRLYLWLSIVVFLISGCSTHSDDSDDLPQVESMVRIPAGGQWMSLGLPQGQGALDEQPRMWVRFSSDFLIDTTEVTTGLFQQLLPGLVNGDDDLPAAGITWYDALLFCNMRSKVLGFDTVYQYGSVVFDAKGHAIQMENLAVDWSVRGFRLPTEAEWEFAAHGGQEGSFPWGSDTSAVARNAHAWFDANSQGNAHVVASKIANLYHLYDMAGNLMEWVWDAKGSYTNGDTLIDFAGAAAAYERIAKGGSFRHPPSFLRIAERGDTYSLTGATRSEYLGFRTVLSGAVVASISGSETVIASGIYPSMSSIIIGNFLKTPWWRMVVVHGDDHALSFWQNTMDAPMELSWPKPIYHPVISPDGQYVAWCTRQQGQQGESRLLVGSLAEPWLVPWDIGEGAIPRWWVDSATQDTFLVYGESAIANSHPDWIGTQTFRIRMHNGRTAGVPEVIASSGSWGDGLSKDARWLYSGYTALLQLDRRNGRMDTLFQFPENGKDSLASAQVCNVSLHPSTGNVLFLDFGYTGKSHFTGGSYGIHEYLFESSPNGSILRWWQAPQGNSSWDHSEFSNRNPYAIAVSKDSLENAHALWILDLDDSIYVKILEGGTLMHPALWLGDSAEIGDALADSAGMYNRDPVNAFQQNMAMKLQGFLTTHRNDYWFALGNSAVQDGLDPVSVGGHGYNMGFTAADWGSLRILVMEYLLPFADSLQWIGIALEPAYLNQSPGENVLSALQNSWGYQHDRNHGVNPAAVALAPRVFPLGVSSAEGWFQFPSNGYGSRLAVENFSWNLGWTTINCEYCHANIDTLKALALRIQAMGKRCVIFNMPVNPLAWQSSEYYSAAGPMKSVGDVIVDDMHAFAKLQSSVHFFDANKDAVYDYDSLDFTDSYHLSEKGARKFSQRLGVWLGQDTLP